jgi:hypothetical protein
MSETKVRVGQRWKQNGSPEASCFIDCAFTITGVSDGRASYVYDDGFVPAPRLVEQIISRCRLLSDAPDQKTERDWSRWLPPADTEDCGIPMAVGQVRAWRAHGRAIVFRVTVANPLGGGSEVLAGSDPIDKPGCSRGWTGGAGVLVCNPGEEPRSPEELYGVAKSSRVASAGEQSAADAVAARAGRVEKAGITSSPPAETKPALKKHDFSNPYVVHAWVSVYDQSKHVDRLCVDCGSSGPPSSPCTPRPGWRERYEASLIPVPPPAPTRVPRHLDYSTASLEAIMRELYERSGFCPPRGRR